MFAQNDKLLIAQLPPSGPGEKAITAENFEQFLVNNLGLQQTLVKYALQMPKRSDQTLEVPGHMLRELVQKGHNRVTETVKIASMQLQDLLYVFRVIKTFSCQLQVEVEGAEGLCGSELVQKVFSLIPNIFELPQNLLYLVGRALSYAMAHCTKIPSNIPIQLIRLFTNSQFKYSKNSIEFAKFDLLQNGVDFVQLKEFSFNGLSYSKAELNDDILFVVMLANNKLIAQYQDKIEAILSGFQDVGGLAKELVGFNAVQLSKMMQ